MAQDPPDEDCAAHDAELSEREPSAAQDGAKPHQSAQLADERDGLGDERDVAADARDRAAQARRQRAAARDVDAAGRDRRSRQPHDDADEGFPDRFLAARDVDASAGDRADALADESHARRDRQRAREDRQHAADDRTRAAEAADRAEVEAASLLDGMASRAIIGVAQGLLMARLDIGPDEAFARLVSESQAHNVKVRDIAWSLVREATP